MKKITVALLMVALCTVAVQDASAQANFGLKGIGGRIGLVNAENLDSSFGFDAVADLGTVSPVIGVEARLGYWAYSESQFGVEAKLSDISVSGRGKYMFPTANPKLTPFAGAGLGLHFLHMEATVPAIGPIPAQTIEASETRLGLDIGGGLAMHASPQVDIVGEVWYGIVSDFNQLSFKIGATRWFGN
jgi:opacity protein-like surface antigen